MYAYQIIDGCQFKGKRRLATETRQLANEVELLVQKCRTMLSEMLASNFMAMAMLVSGPNAMIVTSPGYLAHMSTRKCAADKLWTKPCNQPCSVSEPFPNSVRNSVSDSVSDSVSHTVKPIPRCWETVRVTFLSMLRHCESYLERLQHCQNHAIMFQHCQSYPPC